MKDAKRSHMKNVELCVFLGRLIKRCAGYNPERFYQDMWLEIRPIVPHEHSDTHAKTKDEK